MTTTRSADGVDANSDSDTHGTLQPNWLLVALPTAIQTITITRTIGFAAVVLVGTASFARALRVSDRISLSIASLILPTVGFVIFLRPNYLNTIVVTAYVGVVCVAMAFAVTASRSRHIAVVSLVDGIGVFLVAAIVLRYVGVGGSGSSQVVMGNLLTGGERVYFGFAGALTLGPAMAAAYLVAIVPILRYEKRYRLLRFIGVAAAIYVLVLGDRRSALLSAVVILPFAFLAPRRYRQFVPWVLGFYLALPFALRFTGLSGRLSLASYKPSALTRGGGRDVDTGLDRLEIWSRSITFYEDRVDWFHQMFGYGTYGHTQSGASSTYSSLFGGRLTERILKSPHNSLIQTMFDGGAIAAATFLVMVVWLATVFARRNSPIDLAALSMLATLAIVGSTENIVAPGYPQPAWFTVAALSMIGLARERTTAALRVKPSAGNSVPTPDFLRIQQRAVVPRQRGRKGGSRP